MQPWNALLEFYGRGYERWCRDPAAIKEDLLFDEDERDFL